MAGRSYGGVSAADRVATRRASLLESCRAVIGREGVGAVTVEAVCADSALGKRYFYESFPTRDDLLLAVADEFYTGLLDRMRATIDGVAEAERAPLVVEALVESLRSDERLARLYVESPATPVLAARRHLAIDEYTRFVAAEVLPGAPRGRRAKARRLLATRLLVAGTTELVADWLAGEVEGDVTDVIAAIGALGAAAAIA
ncbi:hypothetical protein ASE01_02760 [Nocardioides sp. Root190]|uniref:TetR/AcrR family transcriptional regulator n=1 Tax=Nocardioides sp. Root190 TaxID=1736488 RepID=UPI0006F56593|nr:TetR family transcriptional regulator [Nocardioides sp. Root190]KRB80411.1 hypothetical protein ASE01_02760 [Nocardioides sp. Root190]